MRSEMKTTALFVAALTVGAIATGLTPLRAQEVDPDVAAQYDTPEMTRVIQQVERMPLEEHAALVDRLRSALDGRLLTPDAELLQRYGELKGRDDAGVARLITRGLFDKRTRVRGGGAYFSFVTQSNDYNKTPDIELQNGKFRSGFAGGFSACQC